MRASPALIHSLGKVICLRRKHKGYTQQFLAEQGKIDQSYLSEIERGLRNPSYEVLFNLAKALDTVPSDISKEVEAEIHCIVKDMKSGSIFN